MLVRHLATGAIGFKSITLELSTRLGTFLKSVSPVSMYFHDVSWNPRSFKEVGPKKYQVPWPGKSTSATPPCRRPGHTLRPVCSGVVACLRASLKRSAKSRDSKGCRCPSNVKIVYCMSYFVNFQATCFYQFLSAKSCFGWHITKCNKTIQPFAELCSKSLLLVFQGSADRLAFASRAMIWQSFQALQISQCCTYSFCGVLKKEHLWYDRNLGKSSLWNPEQNFLSCRHGFVLFGTEQSSLWRVGVGDKSAIRVNALSKSGPSGTNVQT